MSAIFIIYFVICFAILPFVIFIEHKVKKRYKYKNHIPLTASAPFLFTLCAVIMAFACFGIPEVARAQMIGDAVEVAEFEDADLYQDADGSYFYVTSDDWNPALCYYKRYISEEKVGQKIKDLKMLEEYQKKTEFLFSEEY